MLVIGRSHLFLTGQELLPGEGKPQLRDLGDHPGCTDSERHRAFGWFDRRIARCRPRRSACPLTLLKLANRLILFIFLKAADWDYERLERSRFGRLPAGQQSRAF